MQNCAWLAALCEVAVVTAVIVDAGVHTFHFVHSRCALVEKTPR